MRFDYTQHYARTPAQVVGLLRDPGFVAEVARRAEAHSHTTDVTDEGVTLTLMLPAPPQATPLIGTTVTVEQAFRFDQPAPGGSITGTTTTVVPGTPISAHATVTLDPAADAATVAHIVGEVNARVPLIGGRLERLAEPLVARALREIELAAADWPT